MWEIKLSLVKNDNKFNKKINDPFCSSCHRPLSLPLFLVHITLRCFFFPLILHNTKKKIYNVQQFSLKFHINILRFKKQTKRIF